MYRTTTHLEIFQISTPEQSVINIPKMQAMLFQQTSLQAVKLTSSQLVYCTDTLEFLANCRGNVPNRHIKH